MDTYISKEKFQFITEFGKKTCYDGNGNVQEIDFGSLSISERIFLSAYLTMFSAEDEINKNNIYMSIFDFNREKKHGKKYTVLDYEFCDEFLSEFSHFIKERPEFFSYIKANATAIYENKTEVMRTQINREEYAILNSIKVKSNYKRFLASLYIIGVAKNKVSTYKLNHVPFHFFCESNKSVAKKYIDQLFKAMEYSEKSYCFKNDEVFFKSGFYKEMSEKYISNKKSDFDIISEFFNEPVTEEKQVAPIKPVEPVIEKKPIIEEKPEEKEDYLAQQIVANYNSEAEDNIARIEREEKRRAAQAKIKSDWSEYYYKDTNAASKLVRKWLAVFDYNTELEKIQKKFNVKPELIEKAINNDYFDDADGGLEMKKRLITALKELRNQITLMVKVEKIFGEGDEKYLFMGYMYKTHAKFMAL